MANYNSLPVLSKIKIGTKYYYLKDSDVRSALDSEEERAQKAEEQVLKDAKAYTDEQIGSLHVITYEVITELPTADAAHEFNTSRTIYLINEGGTKTQDVYSEYICVKNGEAYQWEKIGDTRIDLSNYYTKEEVDEKISAEKTRAETAESALSDRLDEVEKHSGGTLTIGDKTYDGGSNVEVTAEDLGALTEVPQASDTIVGGIKIGHTEAEGEAAVKLDADGKAYVEATTYSAKENGGLLLEGTEFSIKEVSTDLIKNGSNTFIINGGGAAE